MPGPARTRNSLFMAVGQQWLVRIPRSGETCVFPESAATWRRDALMFDRVYAPLQGSSSPGYHVEYHRNPASLMAPDIPIDFSFSDDALDQKNDYDRGVYGHWIEGLSSADTQVPNFWENFDEQLIDYQYRIRADRELQEGYRGRGVMGTWCVSEEGLFLKRFSEGATIAYQGALNNLPIVNAEIGWDEVRSFRQDSEAVRKYRDLRLWLAEGLKSTSEQHATDLIAQRIEDYRWAIRKHGLLTVTGALANLWDWKQSVALVAGVGAASTLGGPAVAALVGGLALTSGVGAYFAQRKIAKEDMTRGPGREVAILVDIQDRFAAN